MACVISGFEPLDILQAVVLLVRQVKSRNPRVEIQYRRGVNPEGNLQGPEIMARVFEPRMWNGAALGSIPGTGLALREELCATSMPPGALTFPVRPGKIAGVPLRGCSPGADPAPGMPTFSPRSAHPQNPVGPCMVSFEGSCAAAFKYDS